VTVVRLDVDRPLEEKRLVETVQLVLNRFGSALDLCEFVANSPSALSRSAARIP
jgi:hypothetical protein